MTYQTTAEEGMGLNRRHRKKLAALLAAVLLLGCGAPAVGAYPGYDSYSYNYWGDIVVEPAPYTPYQVLTGDSIAEELGALKDPADMCVGNGRIYIADSGNNRIVVLREDFTLELVIKEFYSGEGLEGMESDTSPEPDPAVETDSPPVGEDKEKPSDGSEEAGAKEEENGEEKEEPPLPPGVSVFSNPQGVYATTDGHLYVADTDNGRLVEFDETGAFVRFIGKPASSLIGSYKPMKLAVDGAGRIYVTAYGVNLGLIELDKNGEFQTFIGAIEVTTNMAEYIWKNYFTTKEQRERMTKSIPTEYSNIFLDEKQFIYGTISTLSEDDIKAGADVVRRLNPTGVDVLRRLGNVPVAGDVGATAEGTKFNDIAATSFGTYFVLDSAQGKIFTYDADGNLLFAFGQLGNRWGNTQKPAALCLLDDGQRLLLLDSYTGQLLVYDSTDYGSSILRALELGSHGKMEEAYGEWEHVLKLNSNNEYAYVGISQYYLKQGKYQQAMEYAQKVNNRAYYDKAFVQYRKNLMQGQFGFYVTAAIVLVAGIMAFVAFRKFRRKVREFKWQ